MNHEEHRKRHIELHQALDELLADFLSHAFREIPLHEVSMKHSYGFLSLPVLDFLKWSHKQTLDPDEHGRHDREVTP